MSAVYSTQMWNFTSADPEKYPLRPQSISPEQDFRPSAIPTFGYNH